MGVPSHIETTLRPLRDERDRLIDQWVRLNGQAEAVSNKIKGLELAISLIEKGDEGQGDSAPAKDASNVKALLLDLAIEAKNEGLNANIAVIMAAKRGIALKRGTAASNLSRLKTDKVLVHEGDRYRLPEFSRSKSVSVTFTPGTTITETGFQTHVGNWPKGS